MSKYSGGVPPGLSSEEDSDDEYGLTFPKRREKPNYNKDNFSHLNSLPQLSPVEQLFDAVKNGNLNQTKELIFNNKVDLNSIHSNWTPLMFACFYGHPDIVSVLLENGADINFHKEFFTPLMAVCASSIGSEEDRLKCVEILLQNNVNVNACDRFRTTALMLAAKEGLSEIVKKLINGGSDLNKYDKEGWTALFFAVNYNKPKVVDVLLQAGANTELKDTRGRYLYELAIIKGLDDIADKVAIQKQVVEEEVKLFSAAQIKTVEQMLNELPSRNKGINPGFPSDVYGLLYGMNMEVYSPSFYKNNIQLGEFLVINNERLKEIGVRFSSHRKKILQSIKRFHLHRWQKSSIGLKPRDEKISLVDGLKLIANCTRQLHIIQSTIFYLQLNKPKVKSTDEFKKMIKKAIHQADNLQSELVTLQTYSNFIDSTQKVKPVDLIKPKESNQSKASILVKIGIACFFGSVLVWKNKEFCTSLLKIH